MAVSLRTQDTNSVMSVVPKEWVRTRGDWSGGQISRLDQHYDRLHQLVDWETIVPMGQPEQELLADSMGFTSLAVAFRGRSRGNEGAGNEGMAKAMKTTMHDWPCLFEFGAIGATRYRRWMQALIKVDIKDSASLPPFIHTGQGVLAIFLKCPIRLLFFPIPLFIPCFLVIVCLFAQLFLVVVRDPHSE